MKINVYEILDSGKFFADKPSIRAATSTSIFSSAQSARWCGAIASTANSTANTAASSARYFRWGIFRIENRTTSTQGGQIGNQCNHKGQQQADHENTVTVRQE